MLISGDAPALHGIGYAALGVANYADSGDTAGSLYPKFISRGAMLRKGDYLFTL